MVDLTYLKNNVFAGESGGDYNALYGYANRGSGPFGGVNVTDMTINQVLDFTDPRGPYAQSVKGQIGRVATPTGAYQVVGSTLRDAVRGLGLTGNERYDEATQDRIGQWIYENQGPQAWEGWGKTGGGGGDTSLMGGTGNDNLGAGMEPEQTGLLGFLGNDEKRARLSLALSGLSMFPNQAIQQMALDTISQAQQGRLDQRAQDKIDAQTNKTMQFIANLKTPQAQQALAYLQGGGSATEALKMALQTTEPVKGVAVGRNLINPITGEVIYQDTATDPEKVFGNEMDLIKTYRSEPEVQKYAQAASYYDTMRSAYDITLTNPEAGGVGDLAIVFSFMKMLDPTSTVNSGEQANASNTAGVPDQVRDMYNQIRLGSTLTPRQRESFLIQGGGFVNSLGERLGRVNELYTGAATRGGVQPNFIITPLAPEPFTPTGAAPPPTTGAAPPPTTGAAPVPVPFISSNGAIVEVP